MTKTQQAIRAFSGPSNAHLRQRIRDLLARDQDPRLLARSIRLTALSTAKLQAVYEAWHSENQVLAGPDSGADRHGSR